jgi:hypothetical protein
VGVDAFRIGFFADDFHFLDVARRVPIGRALSGQWGIWPWYRPLSRELYFEIAQSAGPAMRAVAHGLSLACLVGCTWLLWRIGRRLVGTSGAAIAVCLFVSHDFTKFLTGWASGFQDLLALFLTLLGVAAELERRRALALCCALFAPLAKETGFLLFPLLPLIALWSDGLRSARSRAVRLAPAFLLVVAIHAAVRLAWTIPESSRRATLAPGRLVEALAELLGGFVAHLAGPGPGSLALALLAAAAAGILILAARSTSEHSAETETPVPHATGFLLVAAALGLSPLIMGHALRFTLAHGYHAFPALPWLALLLGGAALRVPERARRAAVPLLVGWNTWAFGVAPTDLDVPDSWSFRRWDWHEAVRLTAVSRRLSDDVRRELAERPDSLVVLYENVPQGCFFQTEDGPATREALRDPTARAFWINAPAADLRADRLAVLEFDTRRFHLERAHWSGNEAITRAIKAVIARRADAAAAFTLYEIRPDSARFDRAYVRAAAALLKSGPRAYVEALREAGLGDTLGDSPDTLAAPLAAVDHDLGGSLREVLAHPLRAATHAALGRALLQRRVLPRAGLELRVAVALDSTRYGDRFDLTRVMERLGGTEEALAELRVLAGDPSAGPYAVEARRRIEELTGGRAGSGP